ncbi:MAG TPA: hypothetical protein VMR73_01330 [Candidatus Paceibacterota bacterium]|nr:hypothetical protein [Candidatus Paceibacterota bacterium]
MKTILWLIVVAAGVAISFIPNLNMTFNISLSLIVIGVGVIGIIEKLL